MEIRFAQSARRHRIGRAHARHVIEHPSVTLRVPPPEDSDLKDERTLFLGDDESGRPLEVMAVELADGSLFVIHVMVVRDKYRAEYERGR